MKRLFLFCCMACLWCAVQAENTLTLSAVSGHPGDEVEVSVALDNTDAITAFEVLLPLDDDLKYVSGSCRLDESRSDGHQLTAAEVDGTLRIYAYSLTQSAINGDSGKLLTFRLQLGDKPSDYTLVPEIVLIDAAGNRLSCEVKAGKVTILSPELTIETPSVDYGRVPIRAVHTKTISLENSGNEPLEVKDIRTSDATLKATETAFTINPGESEYVSLQYSPVERDAFSGTVTIVSNAVNGREQTVSIVATPFSVNELHVQSASGKSDGIVTVGIKMDNMEPIVAMQCSFNLPEELVFVEGSAKTSERGTNHVATASVSDGTLSLYAYSPDNSAFSGNNGEVVTFDLLLNGSSGYYSLNPENVVLSNIGMENLVSAVSGGSVEIQSPSLNGSETLKFGDMPITSPVTAEYVISNYGSAPLAVERVIFLSEGYKVNTALPTEIAAGENASLQVEYMPQSEGEFSTTMQIYSNDPTARMKSVTIEGNVFEPNRMTLETNTSDNGDCTLSIGMENYSEIVAVQFDLHGIINATVDNSYMVKSDRLENHEAVLTKIGDSDYRILAYSMENSAITDNSGELVAIKIVSQTPTNTTVTLDNIVLSDTKGVNKNSQQQVATEATYGGDPSGIEEIPEENRPVTVYSLNGVMLLQNADKTELEKLPQGIYIINGRKTIVENR